ncbi:pre-mRNA-splicing factor cwc22 [Limtongia smithiae]|uniref:pre-mRNA-splicing factor cwc22 n=1 Tax=Limtongia smithiae TaxID=1125753 RepID=UPI0034D0099A
MAHVYVQLRSLYATLAFTSLRSPLSFIPCASAIPKLSMASRTEIDTQKDYPSRRRRTPPSRSPSRTPSPTPPSLQQVANRAKRPAAWDDDEETTAPRRRDFNDDGRWERNRLVERQERRQNSVRSPSPPTRQNAAREEFSRDLPQRRSLLPRRERSQERRPDERNEQPRRRALPDVDRDRARERERQAAEQAPKEVKPFDAKAEYERLLQLRSGGTYVPPARLRALQSQITNVDPKEMQRQAWESLKKGINGLVNKVNKSNIRDIVQDIFRQNLVRGRGLFCRSMMRAQTASLPFTPVYGAIAAIVNTKLPQIGELLVTRLIIQFRKAFRRNDKAVCISSTRFLAHLCNYQVAHEIIILQILHLLLERPTDDSVEIAVAFMREVGAFLAEVSAPANNGVFERFRAILHEGQLEKRTQYMIEVLFLVRKNNYVDNPPIAEDLDLVEEDDQITHMIGLDDDLNGEDSLNVFKFDPDYEVNEAKYKVIQDEILGVEDGDESGSEDSDATSSEDEAAEPTETKKQQIQDMTNRDLVNLRRTIYLTIRSSMDFEECCHKLLRIQLTQQHEIELVNMIIECCSQEKIYSKFYGLVAERFCRLNRKWYLHFGEAFGTYYDTIHRYETNKIRNIAKLFAHCLACDALSWKNLECIRITEADTTASSRIFLKILFQDMVEEAGMTSVLEHLHDRELAPFFEGLFPRNDPADTRFAINFFTAIGLGPLTDDLREFLKRAVERADQVRRERERRERSESV